MTRKRSSGCISTVFHQQFGTSPIPAAVHAIVTAAAIPAWGPPLILYHRMTVHFAVHLCACLLQSALISKGTAEVLEYAMANIMCNSMCITAVITSHQQEVLSRRNSLPDSNSFCWQEVWLVLHLADPNCCLCFASFPLKTLGTHLPNPLTSENQTASTQASDLVTAKRLEEQ